MLKDYVTKGLQFLQKSSKSSAKAEDAPQKPHQEPAEPLPSPLPAETWDDAWDDDPFAEPLQPERAPGQDDYESGILAYREKKPEEALAALTRAAGAGHMEAQFLCGHMHQHGLAAEPNFKTALSWYKKSAKQGFLRAQLACAAMYEEGMGTEIDLNAQLKCGRMYHSGRAETRSPKKARHWLEIAAQNGSEEARQLLAERF